jgi:pimeloyl-ACP methyl ester carboxylesterase
VRRTRWEYFLRDIGAVARALNNDVHAYVAHSAGALTMMAARHSQGIRAKRYICICAPSYPFVPIEVIERRLSPRRAVLDRYQDSIARQFELSWQDLTSGAAFHELDAELLLVYETCDRIVPHSEGDRIRALCSRVHLIKTDGYTHQTILSAPELRVAAEQFLKSRLC